MYKFFQYSSHQIFYTDSLGTYNTVTQKIKILVNSKLQRLPILIHVQHSSSKTPAFPIHSSIPLLRFLRNLQVFLHNFTFGCLAVSMITTTKFPFTSATLSFFMFILPCSSLGKLGSFLKHPSFTSQLLLNRISMFKTNHFQFQFSKLLDLSSDQLFVPPVLPLFPALPFNDLKISYIQ